jgi:hypothetical protein
MILAVASNVPDIDGTCLAFGPLAFLWRRTVTHCLPGALLLALGAGILFRRRYPHISFKAVVGLAGLGIAGHVFADLWNSYGVVLYWPFLWRRVDLDWVFILDLVIWAILGGALIAGRLLRRYEAWIWRGGLCLLAGYVGLCDLAGRESRRLVVAHRATEAESPPEVFIYPEPFGPTHFRGVTRERNEYAVYEISPFQQRVEVLERLEVEQQNPIVAATRQSEAGRRLDWFFSTAVWSLAPDGQGAMVYGLGFRTKLFPARAPFVFRVAPNGQVTRAHLPSS